MNRDTKKLIPIIIILVIVGGSAFYGGMEYGQSKSSLSESSRQNFQNLSREQGEQFFQGKPGKKTGSSFLKGEVINRDEQSLTLKMPDNGSKIIFFSDSTKISKTTDGSIDDIEIGKQIVVSGEQNSDGSYTAKTIQLSSRYLIPTK